MLCLTNSDFDDKVLRHGGCIFILFYNSENSKDRDLYTIWQSVSRSGVIATFATANLKTQSSPTIIVYQDHLPYDIYNGSYEIYDIINYILICDNIYRDHGLRRYSRDY